MVPTDRREQPDRQMKQGGLARAVGSDETDDLSFRDRPGSSPCSAHLRPYCLPSPCVSMRRGHATPSAKQLRNAVR